MKSGLVKILHKQRVTITNQFLALTLSIRNLVLRMNVALSVVYQPAHQTMAIMSV
jgi:hypothetical protein